MVNFKNRPSTCIPVCGSHPLKYDPLDESRRFEVAEEVLLQPDVDVAFGRPDWVCATIVAIKDTSLRVKARHAFYPWVGTRLIAAGDEFEVGRSQVFVVTVP